MGGGGREAERGRVTSLVPRPFPGKPPQKLARLQVTHTDPGPEGEAGRAAGTPRLAHGVGREGRREREGRTERGEREKKGEREKEGKREGRTEREGRGERGERET